MIEDEPGRFDIVEACGDVYLLDTITGKSWILKRGAKSVWVEISTAGAQS